VVSIHVRVGPKGSVLLATGERDVPSNVRLMAEAVARATKYRPFERGGHAIEVEFDCVVPLYFLPSGSLHGECLFRL